jgi:hypothetical protein
MILYSYYDHCEGRNAEEELRLIALWRKHHAALGFTPMVLGEYHARRHKEFEAYDLAIAELTQKPEKGESRASFLRWLAMAAVDNPRGILMQYNTFLYPTVWDDLNPLVHLSGADMAKLRVYQGGRPSLVLGCGQTYHRQAERFATCHLTGAPPGVTDDRLLEAQAVQLPDSIDAFRYVKDYGQDGWATALAVRYPRSEMSRDGAGVLWQSIPKVRPYTIPQT